MSNDIKDSFKEGIYKIYLDCLAEINEADSIEDIKELLKGLVETRKIMSNNIYDMAVGMDEHAKRLTKIESHLKHD